LSLLYVKPFFDPENIWKVPPGVQPGQQVQVQNPRTGQFMLATVPQGVAPGGFFDVTT
jgi:hypothetical protein